MDRCYEAYEEALKEKHGKLLSCSSYSSSGGMMVNSNSLSNYWLDIKENDGSILKVEEKKPFEKTYKYSYRINDEDLRELCSFIETNRFWAFSRLEFHQDPRFVAYDFSNSSSLSLHYDDTSLGGKPRESFHIDCGAMNQYKFNEQNARFTELLSSLKDKGELLSKETSGKDTFLRGSFADLPENRPHVQNTDPGEEEKTCPFCGYGPVSSRFCPECGALIKK
jgi:hypothetical protein